jgi:hypothetical protein
MEKKSRQPYRKHNSFVELRHKHAEAAQSARQRIAAIRSRDDLIARLSAAHREIFAQAIADIFSADAPAPGRFGLSPSVVEEINTYPDTDVLARYLVHRYRYEMFPQRHLVDGFPPYLQIEPSSICN